MTWEFGDYAMERCETACPGVLISAPQGRSGKTIASLALCRVLAKRGIKVQPFKKGPDYIDPSWLTEAAGRNCYNLDPFLMPEEVMINSFHRHCLDADMAIVEGAMGLFDGPESTGWGSTAHLAQILDLPVILVIDCTRMTGSIAAMVSGYQHFQPNVNVAGVILNNVSGPRHERKLKTSVENHCKIPVVGSIPRDSGLEMAQRHLGHIPLAESDQPSLTIEHICSASELKLDTDAIINIAHRSVSSSKNVPESHALNTGKVQIGVIKDKVFNFYYPDNLSELERAGAELVMIDTLHDRLPAIDGLIIGGGFPEFYLDDLEANCNLRSDIAQAVEGGLPVYAECAGLMYLCRAINWQGQRSEMVGIIPAEIEFTSRPQGHGYVEALVMEDTPLFTSGTFIRGHEFHHSKLIDQGKLEFAYQVRRGNGAGNGVDGIIYKNVLAAYTHLHVLGTPQWAQSFMNLVLRERNSKSLISL